jgi:hypothetical protein
MVTVRRSSRPLLNYAGAVAVALIGTWGVTVSEARRVAPAVAAPPAAPAPAVVVHADEPPPSPDSLAALLIDGPRSRRAPRGQTALLLDVVSVTEQIWSTSERAAVLAEVAELPVLDSSVVTAVARAATHIPSPNLRVEVLRRLLEHHPHAVGASRAAVLDAIGSMTSASARAGTLALFVTRPRLTQPALVDALAHVSRLPSNGERSEVLVAAARANRIEGRARTVYVQAASSISSGRQRSRALSAIGARGRSDQGT